MEQLFQSIEQDGGWIAVATIIALAAFYKFMTRKNTDGEIVAGLTNVIAMLVAPLKEITENQSLISTQLRETNETIIASNKMQQDLAILLGTHDQQGREIKEAVKAGFAEMQTTTADRARQIEGVPGGVYEIMAPKIDEIPDAVQKAIAPHITGLQDEIAKLILSLDEIPDKTTELIRMELLTLNQKIEEVLAVAKKISAPELKAGVDIPPAETSDDKSEEKPV